MVPEQIKGRVTARAELTTTLRCKWGKRQSCPAPELKVKTLWPDAELFVNWQCAKEVACCRTTLRSQTGLGRWIQGWKYYAL